MSTTPFVLEDDMKVPYYILGTDKGGAPGALLPKGATVAVTSADPTIATVVADATALPIPPATVGLPAVPNSGLATIASGFIVPASPVKLGQPVQINVAVTNADGTPGPTGFAQVILTPGTAATINVAFGSPVAP